VKPFRPMRIFLFLIPTFLLSWGSDRLIDLTIGYRRFFDLGITPWGMLIPAFVALILRVFVFKDSQIHWTKLEQEPLWILIAYLALTVLYGGIVTLSALVIESERLVRGVGALVITLWTLWTIFMAGRAAPRSMHRAGLQLGDVSKSQRFVFISVVFLVTQAVLNLVFEFGNLQGRSEMVFGLPIPARLYVPALVILFIPVVVIGVPLSGLAATFGEEYGWRGFLQDELIKIGKLPGVFLIGVIWGIWHFPVILRGVHTYPPTLPGLMLGLIFFTFWGIIQSYAVFKTGSIWTAAFLHGVVNSVYAFLSSYVIQSVDRIFSFGLGTLGLLSLAVVVIAILRDPIWRSKEPDMNLRADLESSSV
jgi:membrane protease YdiL (CAAX protease family)